MPVNRAYITPYATTDSNAYQAFTVLANFADALEQAIGVRLGANGPSNAPAPAPVGFGVSAGNGHFLIQIDDVAASAVQPPIQHQIASSTSADFADQGAITTYTLGLGETTRDIVDPGVTKFWRLRSRSAGSAWNAWQLYSTAAGVVALSSGTLATS